MRLVVVVDDLPVIQPKQQTVLAVRSKCIVQAQQSCTVEYHNALLEHVCRPEGRRMCMRPMHG